MLILVAGVVMNVLLAFVDLHRHRAGSHRRSSASGSSRSSRVRRPPPPGSAGRRDRRRRRRAATSSSRARPPSTGLRDRAGETVVADHRRRRRRPARRDGHAPRPEAEIDAEQGALGISGATKPFEAYFTASTRHRPAERRSRSASSETVRWIGLIVGGLGEPRRLGRHRPDGAAAGRRPGRHRDPDRRHLLEQRARS